MERFKSEINDQRIRRTDCDHDAEHSRAVIGSIKDNLLDLLLKLREIDELTERPIMRNVFQDHEDGDLGLLPTGQLMRMLQEALKLGLMASGGQVTKEVDAAEVVVEDELDVRIPLQSPSSAVESAPGLDVHKKAPFPPCYTNLMANRGTGAVTANSPAQPIPTGE